jgi:hypothetical protein
MVIAAGGFILTSTNFLLLESLEEADDWDSFEEEPELLEDEVDEERRFFADR